MDDVQTVDRIKFSFSEVCEDRLKTYSPLIEIASGTELDCMGKIVEVAAFCEKQMERDPYFIRAYVDKNEKKVVCQTGKKVIFKYLCVKLADKSICNNQPKKSCMFFKEKLAKRLELVHFSQLKNEKGIPQLNCFFDTKVSDLTKINQ